jgi:hypothetical protein
VGLWVESEAEVTSGAESFRGNDEGLVVVVVVVEVVEVGWWCW